MHFFNDTLTCPICGKPRIRPDLSFYVHNILLPKLSDAEKEEWLKYFTTIFSDGFESGDFSAWTGTGTSGSSTISVSSEQAHHGTYSAKFNFLAFQDDCYAYKTLDADQNVLHFRVYLKVTSWTGYYSDRYATFMEVASSAGYHIASVSLKDVYRYLYLSYRDGLTLVQIASAATLNLNQWYCVELEVDRNEGKYRVYLDGSEVTDLTATATPTYVPRRVNIGKDMYGYGASETNCVFYIDCVVVADTYIGPEAAPPPVVEKPLISPPLISPIKVAVPIIR
jgi:hypothetical protein